MSKILWVGPGMGHGFKHWWTDAFLFLLDKGLVINQLTSIDLQGVPNKFFNPAYSLAPGFTEETLRANFFDQKSGWDIIIIDFIEAWLFGNSYWPTLGQTPFKGILHEWETKILELRPEQVWVVHDKDPHSTIIPNLFPDYKLIDIGLKDFFKPVKEIDVWQRRDIRQNPDLTELQEAIKELDLSLTGKALPEVVSRYPETLMDWLNQVVYLSDGGYSRLYLDIYTDPEDPRVTLGSESLDAAKDRWEDSLPLVDHIQRILKKEVEEY